MEDESGNIKAEAVYIGPYEVSATSPGFNPHGGGFMEGFLDEDSDPIVFERLTSCYWTDGTGKMGVREVRRARARGSVGSMSRRGSRK